MAQTMFDPLTDFWLSSDATRLCVMGAVCWVVAGLAGFMEWRRNRVRPLDRLERVGWVPWRSIFLAGMFLGGGFLATGVPPLLAEL